MWRSWKLFFLWFDEGYVIQIACSNPYTNHHLLAVEEQRMAECLAIYDAHGESWHANNGCTFEQIGSKIWRCKRNLKTDEASFYSHILEAGNTLVEWTLAALFEETIFFIVVTFSTEIIKCVYLVVLLLSKQLHCKFMVTISVTDYLT